MTEKELSPRWVNVILRITSRLQRDKQKLLIAHETETVKLIFSIIMYELVLLIISIPLYLVHTAKSVPGLNTEQYKVRRILSLTVLSAITILWVAKLGLVGLKMGFWNNTSELSIERIQDAPVSSDMEKHILEAQKANLNSNLEPPSITSVLLRANGQIQVDGKGSAGKTVVLYIARRDEPGDTSDATIAVAVRSDQDGTFRGIPDSAKFLLQEGEYRVSAITLDPEADTFSSSSDTQSFSLSQTQLSTTRILARIDKGLNVAMVVFIVFGVITTILLT